MKFLCWLMTVYLFCLLAYPCQDEICYSCKTRQACTEKTGHMDGQNEHCHDCSPFCVCNCCHASTLTSCNFYPGPEMIMPETLISLYRSIFLTGISADVWRPPKFF